MKNLQEKDIVSTSSNQKSTSNSRKQLYLDQNVINSEEKGIQIQINLNELNNKIETDLPKLELCEKLA